MGRKINWGKYGEEGKYRGHGLFWKASGIFKRPFARKRVEDIFLIPRSKGE